MKGELNPKLKVGDKIMCFYMERETSVPPGTIGVVTSIVRDPFEDPSESLIGVNWENGSRLSLSTVCDAWKKVSENIDEQIDPNWQYITQNSDVLEHFDWRWFQQFLLKLRNSGITNMFGSSPLLYSGRDHIDRYYGEGREDDEEYIAMLEDADEARDKLTQGVVNYMLANNKNLDDMDLVNRYARHFSQKILGLWMSMVNMTGNL